MPGKKDLLQHWFHLLIGVGAMLLLLAACSRNPTASTDAATIPVDTAQTPLASTSNTPVPATPTTTQATPVSGSPQTIMITNSSGSYGFDPGLLTIKAGTTIIWKNVSSAPHTVTSDDGTTFDSGNMPVGGSYHFTFTAAGSFPYHCNVHPYMRSTIVVV